MDESVIAFFHGNVTSVRKCFPTLEYLGDESFVIPRLCGFIPIIFVTFYLLVHDVLLIQLR